MVPILLLLSATIIIAVIAAVYVTTRDARRALGERARLTVELLSGGAGEALWSMDDTGAKALLAPLRQDADYVSSILFSKDGSVFARDGAAAAQPGLTDTDLIVQRQPLERVGKDGQRQTIGALEVRLSSQRLQADILRRAWMIGGLGTAALTMICGVLSLIIRGVTRPIVGLTLCMNALANGDHDIAVPALERADEVGVMAAAIEVFKANAIAKRNLEAEQTRAEARANAERKAALRQVADTFDADVKSVLATAIDNAARISGTAQAVAAAAKDNATNSAAASAATNESSVNFQAVAAAIEQLAVSIRGISEQAQASTQVARNAKGGIDQAVKLVDKLIDTAERIGDVVALISGIAGQTNLLALNATIEAARAGEVGAGFAVVAMEVKTLAGQTANATSEITRNVSAIQTAIQAVADEINQINQQVAAIDSVNCSIAAAVEEQTAASNEIGRAVGKAAQGSQLLQNIVADVARTAQDNGSASAAMLAASDTLDRAFTGLRAEADRFLARLDAA